MDFPCCRCRREELPSDCLSIFHSFSFHIVIFIFLIIPFLSLSLLDQSIVHEETWWTLEENNRESQFFNSIDSLNHVFHQSNYLHSSAPQSADLFFYHLLLNSIRCNFCFHTFNLIRYPFISLSLSPFPSLPL